MHGCVVLKNEGTLKPLGMLIKVCSRVGKGSIFMVFRAIDGEEGEVESMYMDIRLCLSIGMNPC